MSMVFSILLLRFESMASGSLLNNWACGSVIGAVPKTDCWKSLHDSKKSQLKELCWQIKSTKCYNNEKYKSWSSPTYSTVQVYDIIDKKDAFLGTMFCTSAISFGIKLFKRVQFAGERCFKKPILPKYRSTNCWLMLPRVTFIVRCFVSGAPWV